VSLQWLKEFVDIEVSPEQLADDLTNAGTVVETIEPLKSDVILGLDLTTNRADCLSHLGVAREVATLYQKPLRKVETTVEETDGVAQNQMEIRIEAPQLCARYCARLIKGARIASSPEWLKNRLEALGLRTINNVADVTNYVLMEMGHPLHAFDLAKVEEATVLVREALGQESLVTIDGVERRLSPGMLVIADRTRPIALAGIMGGAESEISMATRDILLESAWFDPVSIRKTAKSLTMHTEASHRFERGADVNMTVPSINRAATLIQELAGGEILQGVIDCYPRIISRRPILLRRSRVTRLMGSEIPEAFVERTLSALDFKILEHSEVGWRVELPTSRLDVEREIDLIEEITRHYGYDKFSPTLPGWEGSSQRRPQQVLQRAFKQNLIHLGYSETITSSFIDGSESQKFSERQPIRILNALSSETEVMRTSLLPGLLRSFLWNQHRGLGSMKLFELGNVYFRDSSQQCCEEVSLTLLASGNAQAKTVHNDSRAFNFFDLKGDIESLLQSVGVSHAQLCFGSGVDGSENAKEPGSIPAYYHPGLSIRFSWEGGERSLMGQLHPGLCSEYKIKQPVWVVEIPLRVWPDLRMVDRVFKEVPRFPSIQRDISLVVETGVTYSNIESTIRQAPIKEIQWVSPFDLYKGEHLPAGKKGISVTICYQAFDRTLLEEEVNRYHEIVIALLAEKLGAQLRT
jgi:phenylalanyl-tRNA synthetase beta chain